MRTRELFRYLVAMIIALSTTVNAMAQERNLKIYFNQYVEGATGAPIMLVTDDNNSYGLPAGLTYSSEGMAWAKEARFFEWVNQDVKDRLIADYVTKNGTVDKKNSHLMISFENFPYEVNGIQWNVMNDLLSGSITEFFKNYNVTTKCTPVSGTGFSYTEEHWAMNIFQHSTSFNKGSIPWQNGAILKGLKSFELSEKYFVELGLGNWTLWNFGQSELSAKCRTFFKAGWNGQEGSNSNITDSDDNNWAFKITFTMPEIRVRNGRDLFVGDVNQIEGYISAHQGAVEVTSNPSDLDRFHFEYFSSNDNVATINQYTGVIRAIKAGNVDITVKLMRGDRDVCSYNYPLTVLNNNNPNIGTSTAEICVVFANGNKGYDLTVGDTNGKIQGNLVSVFGGSGSINVTGNHNGYHYEYTSANTEIAEIDQYTGVITPKKEGDVDISAVLKNGNTVVSNTYTYTLHVFAPNEGLDWNRVKTYNYSYNTTQQNTNKDLWIIKNYQTTLNPSHDWSPITLLKTDTYIKQNLDGSDNNSWKQIAAFTTPSVEYYRAICQKIKIDVRVPKYSKATATYKFAGNVTLVDQGNNNYTRYGLEIKDLGVVSSEEADNEINSIKLNTYNSGKNGMVSDPETLPTIVRAGAQNGYNAFMGASSEIPEWETDNRDSAIPTSETRYLAAMAYIHFNNSYSATTSIGYKGIPTYTYYSHIYYYKNINDGEGSYKNEEVYSEGKTGTMQLNRNFSAPKRTGYTFLGWSTNPEATVAEYEYQGEFCSYDDVNGGGKGPVNLYAVWRPNTYTVTLDPQGGTGGSTSVTAAYGLPLPSGLTAPTKVGYEFKGYYSNQNQEYKESLGQDYGGTQYYDKDMVGVADWDYTYSGVTLYAHWAPKTYIVTFNGTKGAIVPKQMQYYSQKPISDVIYNSDGVMKISFKYGGQCPSQITNGKFKKAGFKLVGFYDSNNVLVATVNVDHPEDRNIYFNESSGYWTRKDGNLVWNCTHDVNLTARYEPKYTVRDGDIIDFGTEYLEVGIDWENSMVHDLLGAAEAEKEAGRISSTNPVMVFDIRNAKYLDNSSKKSDDLMVPLRDKDFISPNLLVYLGEGAYDVIENEIKTDGTCPGLVVTDRFPIKIPYAFNASKASYARDAQVNDAATEQASKSTWGTLCLPYPIKNNNTYKDVSKVIFYELRKHSGNVMQFYKLPEDAEIPANTPVLYERTVGISSAVTIEENAKDIYDKNTWISVPMNPNSIHDWEFSGNLKTTVFCGKGYVNPPAGAQILDGDVYYFKQDKFTYLNPKMEKNGKTYQAAKMTLYPYRAYFYRNTRGSYYSSAKVSEYSILVIGEDGATLDITNEIFGDGEGDGKIYDLNGIRVMKPVKGRLYIVNGQKKVYK